MVETRKNEIRYVTSDPSKMLNKYLAKRVIKTWEESFIDEDTAKQSILNGMKYCLSVAHS
jgi:hypothetical protein